MVCDVEGTRRVDVQVRVDGFSLNRDVSWQPWRERGCSPSWEIAALGSIKVFFQGLWAFREGKYVLLAEV